MYCKHCSKPIERSIEGELVCESCWFSGEDSWPPGEEEAIRDYMRDKNRHRRDHRANAPDPDCDFCWDEGWIYCLIPRTLPFLRALLQQSIDSCNRCRSQLCETCEWLGESKDLELEIDELEHPEKYWIDPDADLPF